MPASCIFVSEQANEDEYFLNADVGRFRVFYEELERPFRRFESVEFSLSDGEELVISGDYSFEVSSTWVNSVFGNASYSWVLFLRSVTCFWPYFSNNL